MASVMPKCNGMDRFALVLRKRHCDVDKVSAGSSTNHAAYFGKGDLDYRVCCHITGVVFRVYVQVASVNCRPGQRLGMYEERQGDVQCNMCMCSHSHLC
jgi:hypothetical protein